MPTDPRQLFFDRRFEGICVHCGGLEETRDHTPARILLDDPLPDDLPVVASCHRCNNEGSDDESYLAVALDCALAGGTGPELPHRPKIRDTLAARPHWISVMEACRDCSVGTRWNVDLSRVQRVVLKLARGHAAYELSEPRLDVPDSVAIRTIAEMSLEERQAFESAGSAEIDVWPEIGSRQFVRALVVGDQGYKRDEGWVVVQPQRYRYVVFDSTVRIVLSEYLACEIVWN